MFHLVGTSDHYTPSFRGGIAYAVIASVYAVRMLLRVLGRVWDLRIEIFRDLGQAREWRHTLRQAGPWRTGRASSTTQTVRRAQEYWDAETRVRRGARR